MNAKIDKMVKKMPKNLDLDENGFDKIDLNNPDNFTSPQLKNLFGKVTDLKK